MSGGGGGASGEVDLPDYMEEIHNQWLGSAEYNILTGDPSDPVQKIRRTDLSTNISNVINDALQNNPYRTEDIYNPSAVLEKVNKQFTDFNDLVTKFDPEARYEEVLDRVKRKIDSVSPRFDTQDVTDLIAAAVDSALAEMTEVFGDIYSASRSGLDTTVAQASKTANNEANRIIEKAADRVEAEVSGLLDAAFNDLEGKMPEIVANAVSAINQVLDGDPFDDIVQAFERRNQRTFARSVNQFTAGMADINAVQSSAFVFGMASLESDRMQDVAEFESQLKLQTYTQILPQYISEFSLNLFKYLQSQLQDISQYATVYANNLQSYNSYFNALMQTQAELFVQKFNRHAQEQGVQDRVALTSQYQIYQQAINGMSQLVGRNIEYEHGTAALKAEIGRLEVAAMNDHGDRVIDIKAKEVDHPLMVFQHGFNALASVTGGTVGFPKEANKAQSAIGGALSGAAAGMMSGGGNPLAIGAGALLGFGAGAFGA